MRNDRPLIPSLVCACLVLVTGCQNTPQSFVPPGAHPSQQYPGQGYPGQGYPPPQYRGPGQPLNTQRMPLDSMRSVPLAQAGHQATMQAPSGGVAQASWLQSSCGHAGCGPSGPTGCAPESRMVYNGPIQRLYGAAASAACGCNSCGTGDCNVTAQGYVEYAPQGWNAYGVDPQEFLCDGGDNAPRARLNKSDRITGLQPEDTVVHYTTDAGDIKFQPSNRVCVYAPRFSSIRKINSAIAGAKIVGLSTVDRPTGPKRFDLEQPTIGVHDSRELGHADVARGIDALRDRNRGVRIEGDLAPIQHGRIFQVLAALSNLEVGKLEDEQLALVSEAANAAIVWQTEEQIQVAIEDLKAPVLTRDQTLEAFTVYDFPDAGRLRIAKMADKRHAKSGEEVSFAIRVQNVGDSAVNHVVITDNLVTRLSYVAESQKSDRETAFITEPNGGQSLRLEWTVKDELKVGESVLIEFKCRVR